MGYSCGSLLKIGPIFWHGAAHVVVKKTTTGVPFRLALCMCAVYSAMLATPCTKSAWTAAMAQAAVLHGKDQHHRIRNKR